MKNTFSVKLLKKIKQNSGSPNKKYNTIFEHIHRNIRAYPRNKKKVALINDWESTIEYW